jgi:hypothetical protein
MTGLGRECGLRGADWTWERGRACRLTDVAIRRPTLDVICFYFPGCAELLRVAIEYSDARGIRDRQAYKWTDVYFRVTGRIRITGPSCAPW